MAGIKANSSDKVVIESSLYTGVTNCVVVAVNPTFEELKAMGINAQQEPNYKTENTNGKSKMRLDFYLKQVDNKTRARVSFWIEDEIRKNKDGSKVQWVNKFGVFAWSANETTPPQYDWFSTEGARPAFIGEELLSGRKGFIPNWANLGQEDQAIFDDITEILKGNVKEVKEIHAAIPNNQVKCLLGVRDGKYQDVYTKFFDRGNRLNYDNWKKELTGDYGEFKSDYQGKLDFIPFVGSTSVNVDTPTDVPSTNTGGEPKKYKF